MKRPTILSSLPPHVRSGGQPRAATPNACQGRSASVPRRAGRAPQQRSGRYHRADMRLFLLAYCACFLAVSAFIW
jgi:hypothetical protein